MARQTEIRQDLGMLKEIRNQLGSGYYTRVGILGGGMHMEVETKTNNKGDKKRVKTKKESPLSNADIGVIHEFGSDAAGIPPRSFLRFPIELKKKDIINFLSSGVMRQAIAAGDFRKCFKMLGVFAEGIVDEAFATSGFGTWPPNAESTIERKGSNAPLIDSGQLKRSITSDVKKR